MQMLLNNRYQVIQTLGSGGFGETFLAEDTQMPSHRRCVIKQLRPIQNNPQIYQLVQERFQREAAILEDLGGSNHQIPTLYAYFQSSGQFYVVQEWIEGETLTKKVQQQGLFSESALRDLLVNLLPILEYVHSKRIIHRDIKPDNIIIRHRDGKPVLIDFGAVRESMGTVVNSQGNPTSSIVIGTPGYMPSEQAAGRPLYSSDIYSLGMTAIYLLSGKQPQELETDPRTGEIVWRNYALSVSPTLAGILDRAIAYHPRERFATAREMLEALQIGTVSVPPTVPYQQPQVIPQVTPQNIPNTVAVSPRALSTPLPVKQNNSQKGIVLGSLIVGGLIGAAIVIGFAINRQNQIFVDSQTPSSTEVSPSPEQNSVSPETSAPSTNNQQAGGSPEPSNSPTSTQQSSSAQPETQRSSPEQFVQDYYARINEGQYQAAWNLLSPSYQNNQRLHPNGYLSYLDWWGGQVGSVNVDQVSVVESNTETSTVDAQLTYFMKSGKQVSSSVTLSLLWDVDNNRWAISDAN
ncbi:serine/threonine-protein kinase [Nostoc sp. FACHB-110]|uniref:serine/threonine-protein kinase n=1 Tax=Nostoc sp. FACHB-110 TaxID=2692834 RepID=UPI0016898384|nr:serine/threonine-protein kinase [Nostoc sp. FACHB-110]MBD2438653.1 serine/threonine protein kinase [Nostoc sp. FACHB-110]